eukprot:GHVN01049488.1.p1 GENE.GHVN01049488.1~~GHVN01049488.1.p1  ORF type:complete len:174 (+),score=19.22 GHVN01049488.1:276-797(+)
MASTTAYSLRRVFEHRHVSTRLHLVCESLDLGNGMEPVYRLSDDKLAQFISDKLDCMAKTAREELVLCSEFTTARRFEAQSDPNISPRSEVLKNFEINETSLRQMGFDLVSSYLPPSLANVMKDKLGFHSLAPLPMSMSTTAKRKTEYNEATDSLFRTSKVNKGSTRGVGVRN